MLNWIISNEQWLFSGVGVAVIGGFIALLKTSRVKAGDKAPNIDTASADTHSNTNRNNINIVNNVGTCQPNSAPVEAAPVTSEDRIRRIKDSTRILFIDDDDKFKVVKILKTAGWSNTTIVKDVASLHDHHVATADVFFVDIQGVGVKLGFRDEGLGLAAALKEKYPEKKLVIYSAEPRGERFHKALRKADASLAKNADPYEFQQLVEEFAGLS